MVEKSIKFTCQSCEVNVSLPAEQMEVSAHPENDFGHLVCRCPECLVTNYKKIRPGVAEVLVASGVRLVIEDRPTPDFMEEPTDDLPITDEEYRRAANNIWSMSDRDLQRSLLADPDAEK